MKDLTISLEDRPGTLADLGEALGNAGINIEGACAVTSEGRAIVHILVEDDARARSTLEAAGIKVEGETEVIVMDMADTDRPGSLGEAARTVADAGINISLMYLATRTRGVVATSDNARVRELFGM
jgi:hypothetical protein